MHFADNEGPDQPAHAQADQGLRCPLKESKDTVVYVGEQRTSGCMRILIWAFAVRIWHQGLFLVLRIIIYSATKSYGDDLQPFLEYFMNTEGLCLNVYAVLRVCFLLIAEPC